MATLQDFEQQVAALEAATPETQDEAIDAAQTASSLYRTIGLIAWSPTWRLRVHELKQRLVSRQDAICQQFDLKRMGISDEDVVRHGSWYAPGTPKVAKNS